MLEKFGESAKPYTTEREYITNVIYKERYTIYEKTLVMFPQYYMNNDIGSMCILNCTVLYQNPLETDSCCENTIICLWRCKTDISSMQMLQNYVLIIFLIKNRIL